MIQKSSRGSALLLVLWAIIVVSMAVLGLAVIIQSDQSESTAIQDAFLARQVAESALALASHPQVRDDDPLLDGKINLGGRYTVTVQGEGGRLDINRVLVDGRTDILTRLFADWGLNPQEVTALVESFGEWAQPSASGIAGSTNAAGGGTTTGAGNQPFPRLFRTVEEMSAVRGMSALIAKKPDWQDYFTVWTEGTLDLNYAPADLIAAVLGDQRMQIATLITNREEMRLSPDEDMRQWTNVGVPLGILGVNSDSTAASFLSVGCPVRRIEVTATVGARTCRLGNVLRKDSLPLQVFYHYEL